MPKVPIRKLSYGEELDKLRKLQKIKDGSSGTRNYAIYKFQEMPAGSKNGAVKTTKPAILPHPFKCSKCDYIAQNKPDFNEHWSLEH